MSNIRSFADVELRSSLVFGKNLSDFPANPRQGQANLVNGALWVFATISGISTWYPLTNKKNSYVHTQAVESFQWTVAHGLATDDVVYAAYDMAGSLLVTSRTRIDENTFRLNFTSATSGRVVVFADSQASTTIQTNGTNANVMISAGGTGSQVQISSNTEVRLTAPTVRAMGDLNVSADIIAGGNLTIAGNLVVSGTTSQVNSTVVSVKDNIVVYNQGEIGSGVTNRYSGVQIDRGDLADVRLVFDEQDDKWKVGEVGSEIALVTANEIANLATVANTYTKTEADARYMLTGAALDGGVL